MYTYTTENSIENDMVFHIDVIDENELLVCIVSFNCTDPDSHGIYVAINPAKLSFQKLAEVIQEASNYLDSLVEG